MLLTHQVLVAEGLISRAKGLGSGLGLVAPYQLRSSMEKYEFPGPTASPDAAVRLVRGNCHDSKSRIIWLSHSSTITVCSYITLNYRCARWFDQAGARVCRGQPDQPSRVGPHIRNAALPPMSRLGRSCTSRSCATDERLS